MSRHNHPHVVCAFKHVHYRAIYSFVVKAKLEATAEDASKAKTSLVRVSSELEAKKRDLENSKKQLEDARQCLKEKVEECKTFEVSGRLVTLLIRMLFSLLTL